MERTAERHSRTKLTGIDHQSAGANAAQDCGAREQQEELLSAAGLAEAEYQSQRESQWSCQDLMADTVPHPATGIGSGAGPEGIVPEEVLFAGSVDTEEDAGGLSDSRQMVEEREQGHEGKGAVESAAEYARVEKRDDGGAEAGAVAALSLVIELPIATSSEGVRIRSRGPCIVGWYPSLPDAVWE